MARLSEEQWKELTQCLELFQEAWNTSPWPPSIAAYVSNANEFLASELIPEIVKLDLEQRWERGLTRLLEDYFEDIPALRTLVSASLVFEEYLIRRNAGDSCSPTELFGRFPRFSRELARLMQMDPALRSTFLSGETAVKPVELSPGETIDEFELLLKLGCGAFATVFLARQKSMQRLVALKVSSDHGTEPQTLAQLDHNNIVRVYDQRIVSERGVRLLYMQYASGGTLSDVVHYFSMATDARHAGTTYLKCVDAVLESRGEIRPSESRVRDELKRLNLSQLVCWIGSQLGRALEYAHRSGVLHRDIKPANILLTAEGVPRLADFNVSFGSLLEGTSAEQGFGGSLAYMSPEQLEACNPAHTRSAGELDCRSDLFSLGIVLCELLTGRRPFDDSGTGSCWSDRLNRMTLNRRKGIESGYEETLRRSDEVGLAEVLMRCLASDASDRYQCGADLSAALELCLHPDAKQLLCDDTLLWKRLVRRWPQGAIVIVTLVPNLITAIFNFLYNRGEILLVMPDAEAEFMRIQSVINLVAFPLGIASSFWLVRSVTHATQVTEQLSFTSEQIVDFRTKCLRLGNVSAGVGLTLWLIAAPLYPLALHFTRGNVPSEIYAHFIASLTLCGLIAAAYPFFGVTLISLRCLYPTLVRRKAISEAELSEFRRLNQSAWIHLFLAAAVPMLAVMILAITGLHRRFALAVLAVSGILGFGVAAVAFRCVQRDLLILAKVVERAKGDGR